jgi:CRISPR-associated endonuclease/helicase Cas3
MERFEAWFERVAGHAPHPWQKELGEAAQCTDRLLRVPTGFGKTAGTVLAWAYHRRVRDDRSWPTRLVFCLPMRVLVEQTEAARATWFQRAGLDVPVTVLLGGRREVGWLERPDVPSVVVGTQDMLLSRALGRGYGSARGLWPMELGLLHSDVLWVLDEIQLMDVGLATSAQLHAFRLADAARGRPRVRPAFSWWMSATLQPGWLRTVDMRAHLDEGPLPLLRIPSEQRRDGLWAVDKALEHLPSTATPRDFARAAGERHEDGGLTLVIVNTVEKACAVHAELARARPRADLRLVHSRFRGVERRGWAFLSREAERPAAGRIVVATQVVEAGVDISASTLVTELAPWPSLVQRFGRCARYAGERGKIVVLGAPPRDAKAALPYTLGELEAAAKALADLGEKAGPRELEEAEERWAREDLARIDALFPYEPLHVLRRSDFDELFDTSPDLSGAELDVARYIRTGEDRDCTVFWRAVADPYARVLSEVPPPVREELCPVPVHELREFVADLAKEGRGGFVFDYVTGTWRRVERILPGMRILLPTTAGGYRKDRGWDPSSKGDVEPVHTDDDEDPLETTAASADDDHLSAFPWKSIATHGGETSEELHKLAMSLDLPARLREVLALAARWHDAGKAHETFQSAINEDARRGAGELGARRDLAKAPGSAWRRPAYPDRPGFRHELVSTLMMFEALANARPEHAALVAPHRRALRAAGIEVDDGVRPKDLGELGRELSALTPEEFDLAAYVVCAHHGKVRVGWAVTPLDQGAEEPTIHGVREGDRVGPVTLATAAGAADLPELRLSLACAGVGLSARYGRSWTERVLGLLDAWGPFTLAFLEAVLRVADWRASQVKEGV